jgi:5-methylcytosine-specific restriction protein B
MARILGELITLLEDSKRARHKPALGDQPLKATLPYTRESFIVPPNLHIIGTMNTADRSLTGLDVALRRRFHFVELPPRPEALSRQVGGVDLQRFLRVLNDRIESHLDADHSIGHALFNRVESIGQIQDAMIQKVIPLLREYFHDRPEALKAVLEVQGGDNFLQFTGQGRSLRFTGVNQEALGRPDTYRLFIEDKPQ